jgi:hypothetical protein
MAGMWQAGLVALSNVPPVFVGRKVIGMNEIYTLLIELEDCMGNDWVAFPVWKRTVEMRADATVNNLHQCIQDVIDFDDDHLYAFYVAKKVRSKQYTRQFVSEGITEEAEPLNTPLNQIFPLPTGHLLFYLFDYGDDWRFKIRKTNRKQQFAAEGVEYPRVVGEEGENPRQYPMWDDGGDVEE